MSPQHTASLLKLASLESDVDSSEMLDSDQYSPSGGSSCCGSCSGCDQLLAGAAPWLEAGGRRWHAQCFSCSVCGQQPEERCFITRGGQLLCVHDFNKLLNTCRRCGLLFTSPWELAIRVPGSPGLRFHPQCFSCVVCRQHMKPRDLFAAVEGEVRCPLHAATPLAAPTGGDDLTIPFQQSQGGAVCRARKKHSRKTAECMMSEMGDGRKKRHRIQFSVQQLQDLQVAFAVNPSPDSKSIHQLATRLALGKQHVQVWFQNRRAKERRVKSEGSPSSSLETVVT